MTFYAFSLDVIDTVFQRGQIDDVDIITFQILVNQQVRAQASGSGVGITGLSNPMSTSVIDQSSGPVVLGGIDPGPFGWLAGPLSLAPGDSVRIIYSGTNTSDSQLEDFQKTKIELGILDALLTAGISTVAGDLASKINQTLGSIISDPVGTILGIKPEGPCNGPVFGDGIDFPGESLANLPFDQEASDNFVPDGGLALPDGARATVFMKPDTGTYTDEATHNTTICGHVAETKVGFTIYRLDRGVSLRAYGGKRFGLRTLVQGVRQLGNPPFTVRKLLQLNQ